jgi:transposase
VGAQPAKNQIHAVLMRQLVGRPPCADLFGVKGREWLAELQLPPEESETVDSAMRQIEFFDSEISEIERRIAQAAVESAEIRRLMSVPGANVIVAASFLAAIGDIHRFQSPRKLVGYLGLDPRVRQSGVGPATHGHISKRGSIRARHALVEACWTTVRQPVRCIPSISASAPAAVTLWRSSPPRASSRPCSGVCSPAKRTTPTSSPR